MMVWAAVANRDYLADTVVVLRGDRRTWQAVRVGSRRSLVERRSEMMRRRGLVTHPYGLHQADC